MIFGNSHTDRDRKLREYAIRHICGIRRFAFLPVRLENGRWLWWEPYYEFYDGEQGSDNRISLTYDSYYGGLIFRRYQYYSKRYIKLRSWCQLENLRWGSRECTPDEIDSMLAEQADILGRRRDHGFV